MFHVNLTFESQLDDSVFYLSAKYLHKKYALQDV